MGDYFQKILDKSKLVSEFKVYLRGNKYLSKSEIDEHLKMLCIVAMSQNIYFDKIIYQLTWLKGNLHFIFNQIKKNVDLTKFDVDANKLKENLGKALSLFDNFKYHILKTNGLTDFAEYLAYPQNVEDVNEVGNVMNSNGYLNVDTYLKNPVDYKPVDDISKFDLIQVDGAWVSVRGAMGDPGKIKLVCNNGDVFEIDMSSSKYKKDDVSKVMDYFSDSELFPERKQFKFVYIGAGNYFYVYKEYYQEFMKIYQTLLNITTMYRLSFVEILLYLINKNKNKN